MITKKPRQQPTPLLEVSNPITTALINADTRLLPVGSENLAYKKVTFLPLHPQMDVLTLRLAG